MSIKSTDHLGNTYPSIKAMCDHYNIPCRTYRGRIEKGMSQQDALETPNKCNIKDHNGTWFTSQHAMLKHYGITLTTYNKRLLNGWSTEQALTAPPSHTVIDYTGRTFKTEQAMVRYHKKHPKEKVIPNIIKPSDDVVNDHLGNAFSSIATMCAYYDIPVLVYMTRLHWKWDKDDALTRPVYKQVVDKDGRLFVTLEDAAEFHKVPMKLYLKRRSLGWTHKGALQPDNTQIITDHLGREFENKYVMCLYYGIDYDEYDFCEKRGWSIEDILTIKDVVRDHKGNPYRSVEEMCDAYGIKVSTYQNRKYKGWSSDRLLNPVSEDDYQPLYDFGLPAIKITDDERDSLAEHGWDVEIMF